MFHDVQSGVLIPKEVPGLWDTEDFTLSILT
jgi:hypothetical protein